MRSGPPGAAFLDKTARNYIAVTEAFGGASATVADLPIDAGALYVLAGPHVPQTIRDEALDLAEAGKLRRRRSSSSGARPEITTLRAVLRGKKSLAVSCETRR
jgi:hypothetical protein